MTGTLTGCKSSNRIRTSIPSSRCSLGSIPGSGCSAASTATGIKRSSC